MLYNTKSKLKVEAKLIKAHHESNQPLDKLNFVSQPNYHADHLAESQYDNGKSKNIDLVAPM